MHIHYMIKWIFTTAIFQVISYFLSKMGLHTQLPMLFVVLSPFFFDFFPYISFPNLKYTKIALTIKNNSLRLIKLLQDILIAFYLNDFLYLINIMFGIWFQWFVLYMSILYMAFVFAQLSPKKEWMTLKTVLATRCESVFCNCHCDYFPDFTFCSM